MGHHGRRYGLQHRAVRPVSAGLARRAAGYWWSEKTGLQRSNRRAQTFLTGYLGALLIGWGSFISTPEASRCPPRRPDGIRRPPPGPSGAVPVMPSHPGQSVSSVNRGELSQPPTAQSELSPKQPAQWAIECAGTDITLSYREPKEPCGSWSAPRDKLH